LGIGESRKLNCNAVAIIPARGGSKGIPRKSVRLLCGKPLIAYTIEAALSSKLIDRVVVSTEDEEIAEVSKKYGAEVISRPPELGQDDTPSLPVYQHAIRHLEKAEDYRPEIIVILQPTSPLRLVEDIDRAIAEFLKRKYDSIVSICEVEHPPHWMYTLARNRLKPVIKDGESVTRRQDAPKMYRLNGAVYVTSREVIMKENRLIGRDTGAHIMPLERSIDIDTELDFKLADLLMRQRK
jgi:CMP-N,N'-diacetyllegionaminic acid synthase